VPRSDSAKRAPPRPQPAGIDTPHGGGLSMSNAELALRKAQYLLAQEEAGERVLTSSDRAEVERLLAIADEGLGRKAPNMPPPTDLNFSGSQSSVSGDGSGRTFDMSSAGAAFIASKGYREIRDPSRRGDTPWSSG